MIVYRIQPIGSELHGIETEASNGDQAGGVHVFESLPEVYGCREWRQSMPNVELLTIECEKHDLKPNGDYEGVTLKAGRGSVAERKQFATIGAIVEWLESLEGVLL